MRVERALCSFDNFIFFLFQSVVVNFKSFEMRLDFLWMPEHYQKTAQNNSVWLLFCKPQVTRKMFLLAVFCRNFAHGGTEHRLRSSDFSFWIRCPVKQQSLLVKPPWFSTVQPIGILWGTVFCSIGGITMRKVVFSLTAICHWRRDHFDSCHRWLLNKVLGCHIFVDHQVD